ncbi:hypothetical protein M2137_001526 [Parabacteroides sp. PFB2-10]|nr:hypothetical protein [Parabacteroides sp. PFB2-10]
MNEKKLFCFVHKTKTVYFRLVGKTEMSLIHLNTLFCFHNVLFMLHNKNKIKKMENL